MSIDVQKIRADFPILSTRYGKNPFIYLDNAATSQKPNAVIECVRNFYAAANANIHRGLYKLSEHATAEYEQSREKVARFIHAGTSREIIFTRGATEAINLVAASYGRKFLSKGDEIVLTLMEHHANIVPWQMLAEEKGLTIRFARLNTDGSLDLDHWHSLFNERTKIAAFTHVSNALGTINPVRQMIGDAKRHGAVTLIDAAQSVQHASLDVQDLDCDFLVFSGHKVYAPTGIGVLYGKAALLESMPPYQGGGDMIDKVSVDGTTFKDIPARFEAGTPHISGAIGLGAAIDYLNSLPLPELHAHEDALLSHATAKVKAIQGIRIIGNATCKTSVLSFTMDGIHPHDIGTLLDSYGIAIRVGHHCALPLMASLKLPATARASFAFYNTFEEVDAFADSLEKLKKFFL